MDKYGIFCGGIIHPLIRFALPLRTILYKIDKVETKLKLQLTLSVIAKMYFFQITDRVLVALFITPLTENTCGGRKLENN